jgi:hypothetical protein
MGSFVADRILGGSDEGRTTSDKYEGYGKNYCEW